MRKSGVGHYAALAMARQWLSVHRPHPVAALRRCAVRARKSAQWELSQVVPDAVAKRAMTSRFPLERMSRLHEEMKANRFPNCWKIAAMFEMSVKTIQRDFDFMRDRLGLPIEYNAKRAGFYYTKRVVNAPFAWSDMFAPIRRAFNEVEGGSL